MQNLEQINSMMSTAEENKAAEMSNLEKKIDKLQEIIEEMRARR